MTGDKEIGVDDGLVRILSKPKSILKMDKDMHVPNFDLSGSDDR
jgi:hypothetical protein